MVEFVGSVAGWRGGWAANLVVIETCPFDSHSHFCKLLSLTIVDARYTDSLSPSRNCR